MSTPGARADKHGCWGRPRALSHDPRQQTWALGAEPRVWLQPQGRCFSAVLFGKNYGWGYCLFCQKLLELA
jgi:hypothetical protein